MICESTCKDSTQGIMMPWTTSFVRMLCHFKIWNKGLGDFLNKTRTYQLFIEGFQFAWQKLSYVHPHITWAGEMNEGWGEPTCTLH